MMAWVHQGSAIRDVPTSHGPNSLLVEPKSQTVATQIIKADNKFFAGHSSGSTDFLLGRPEKSTNLSHTAKHKAAQARGSQRQ